MENKTLDVNDVFSWCHYHSADQMDAYEVAVQLGQVQRFEMTVLRGIKKRGAPFSGDPDIYHDARRLDRLSTPLTRVAVDSMLKALGEQVAAEQVAEQAYKDSAEEYRLAKHAQGDA